MKDVLLTNRWFPESRQAVDHAAKDGIGGWLSALVSNTAMLLVSTDSSEARSMTPDKALLDRIESLSSRKRDEELDRYIERKVQAARVDAYVKHALTSPEVQSEPDRDLIEKILGMSDAEKATVIVKRVNDFIRRARVEE